MKLQTLAALVAIPAASANWGHGNGHNNANDKLHALAQKAGKMYFGTATDNGELDNKNYTAILDDNKQFGQLTPSNGQKVGSHAGSKTWAAPFMNT